MASPPAPHGEPRGEGVRPAPSEQTAPPWDGLWAEVEAEVGRERGRFATWRALPTPRRLAAVLGVAAVLIAYNALFSHRADFARHPVIGMGLELLAFALLTVVLARELLRPLQSRFSSSGRVLVAIAAALLPAVIVVRVSLRTEFPPPPAPSDAEFWHSALACMGYGGSIGLVFVLVAALFDRGGVSVGRQILLASVSAGFLANFILHLHCASVDPAHLWVGHVGAFVGVLPAVALAVLLKHRFVS